MEPLSADDVACVARWRAAGALWEVPDAANDDWHWVYATLLGGADVGEHAIIGPLSVAAGRHAPHSEWLGSPLQLVQCGSERRFDESLSLVNNLRKHHLYRVCTCTCALCGMPYYVVLGLYAVPRPVVSRTLVHAGVG